MSTPPESARATTMRLLGVLDDEALRQAEGYLTALEAADRDNRGLLATLGIRSIARDAGRSEVEVTPAPHLLNPNGVMHGAVLFAAMDTAMGSAVTSLLEPGEICATVEAKVNYLTPVTAGRLVATANVIQRGGRLVVVEARTTAEDGRAVAAMMGTFIVLRESV